MIEQASNSVVDRIERALDLIMRYGGIDGAHHKQWVLDQVVRILATDYAAWVHQYRFGDGEAQTGDEFAWWEGIAP